MELTGAAALRRSLSSTSPLVPRERRRRTPTRVSCVGRGGGGVADVAGLRYYEAVPRKAVEAAARDLSKLRAMGLVAGDAAKEKILSEATELLLEELSQMKDAEGELKKKQKEEKAAMKALKKQQKETKKAAMECGDDSSDSSDSECEENQSMKMSCVATASLSGMSMSVPQIAESNVVNIPAMDFDKAAMKAMKTREKEQRKAAKKALKMKKEEEKRMSTLNACKDEDNSSCSSESSDSECEVEVVRMSRCATITAPRAPPASTVFPIILPQILDSVAPDARISPGPGNAMQCTTSSSITLVKNPPCKIEVCLGGKCKKSGSLAFLQEFEKEMGTDGEVVGCKCLGECGLGPNVRLQSEGSVGKDGVIRTGVRLDDVGIIVASLLAGGRLGI